MLICCLALIALAFGEIETDNDLCLRPFGDCNFYKNCIKDSSNIVCPSAYDIMYSKCLEYSSLDQSFSDKGIKWAAGVKLCIQRKMSHILFNSKSSIKPYTCSEADHVFFNQHVDCYLYASDISFCDLPLKDQIIIAYHASSLLLDGHMMDILNEGIEVLRTCWFKKKNPKNSIHNYNDL